MRLRRIEVDWGKGNVIFDLRGEEARPLPVVGLFGSSGSGKTILMKAARWIFRNGANENSNFPALEGVNSLVEFDLGSGIATGVIRNGTIVQKLVYPEMTMSEGKISGGMLFYGSERANFFVFQAPLASSEICVRNILHDLYKGTIENSVIWIDDFSLGLDDDLSKEFLQILIKKSLERNNQLIVSTNREEFLQGVGSENIRTLAKLDTNLLQRVIKLF